MPNEPTTQDILEFAINRIKSKGLETAEDCWTASILCMLAEAVRLGNIEELRQISEFCLRNVKKEKLHVI